MEKPTSDLPSGFGNEVKQWEELVSDEVQDMKDSKTIFEDALQEMKKKKKEREARRAYQAKKEEIEEKLHP